MIIMQIYSFLNYLRRYATVAPKNIRINVQIENLLQLLLRYL